MGREGIRIALGRICQRIWRGERFPERWREGVIIPIAKKRGAKEVRDYRGVTLMATAYKVYASVLANRLEKEMEEKEIVSESQAGFRRGRGVMDNIYVVNYLVGRELERGKKVVAALVDLKAAFDSVDRGILERRLREEKVSDRLRERIMEIYEERSEGGRKVGEKFLDDERSKARVSAESNAVQYLNGGYREGVGERWNRGIAVGGKKLRVLGYADDLIILAEGEEEMKWILRRLEGYLEERGLVLNTNKTKLIRFRKGRGRTRKMKWWRGEGDRGGKGSDVSRIQI